MILLTNPLVQPIQQCADEMIMDEGRSYKIDSLDWHIAEIRKLDRKMEAYINVTYLQIIFSGFTEK